MNKKYQNNINMIKNNIVLEIKETNKKIKINEDKLNDFHKNINENKLSYLKSIEQHNKYKETYNDFNNTFNEKKKIINNQKYNTSILPNIDTFTNKSLLGDTINNNNNWIVAQDNIPFSGIKKINNYIYEAEHNLNILWRTKGNNTFNHGLVVWKDNYDIITQDQINNDGYTIIKKTIPTNNFIQFNEKAISSSEIMICNEKKINKWVSFKKENNLDFIGSPLESSSLGSNTVFYNKSDIPIQIKIMNEFDNGKYEFWYWNEKTNVKEIIMVDTKIFKKNISPGYFIAINLLNYFKIKISISNTKKQPDNSFISKWRTTQINRNNRFAFINNGYVNYQIKIFHSEPIYKGLLFLQDYNIDNNKFRINLIKQIKNIEKIKILIDLDNKKIQHLEKRKIDINIENSLLNNIKLINTYIETIIKNKNLLIKQTNISKAQEYVKIIQESQDKVAALIEPITEKSHKKDLSNNEQDAKNIDKNLKQIKIYKNNLRLIDESIKPYKTNIKKALMSNFKKEMDSFLNTIKTNYDSIFSEYNKLNNESVDFIDINNFLIKKKEFQDVKDKIYNHNKIITTNMLLIQEKKKYFEENKVTNDYLFNTINIANEVVNKSNTTLKLFEEKIKILHLKTDSVISNNKITVDKNIENIKNSINIVSVAFEELKKSITEINDTNNNTELDIDKNNKIITDNKSVIKTNYKEKNYKDNDNFLDIKTTVQTAMVDINTHISDILKNHKTIQTKINDIKNIYNTNDQEIKNNTLVFTDTSNQEIKQYYNSEINKIQADIDNFTNILKKITAYENDFSDEKYNKKKKDLDSKLEDNMNFVHETNIYIKLLEIEFNYNKFTIKNNEINDFAIDIINYIESPDINFFEKYIQTNNKYDLIQVSFTQLENNYNLEKKKLTVVIDDINCIKNDISKIKALLSDIDQTQQLNNILNINIKTTKKTIKQINILLDNLKTKKEILEQSGQVGVNKNTLSFQVDPIVVKGSKKQFFRNIKEKFRTIQTILPEIQDKNREYIIRYIYWTDSIQTTNADHAPANTTIFNSNNDIGMMGIIYQKKNNLPFLQFYNLNDIQPYTQKNKLDIGYYFNNIQGVWNYQNIEKTFGNDTSELWLKMWNKNNEILYKNPKKNINWYTVFENNYPTNTRFGYETNKTTNFDLFGKQTTNEGKNGPKQLALRTHAALLGWLGNAEKLRIENIIDNKISLGISRKLNTPIDFDYTNGNGMFVFSYTELDTAFFETFKTVHVKSRLADKYFMFFTIQNKNNNSIINFYKGYKNDLKFNTSSLNSMDIFISCPYRDYFNDEEIDPLLKNDGSYVSNTLNFYKKSGPDSNNNYIFAENQDNIEIPFEVVPYISQKNASNRFLYHNDNNLFNIYLYNNTALKSIIKIENDTTKYIIEQRKIDINTYEINNNPDGLIKTFLYQSIVGFQNKNKEGKYFLVKNIKTDELDFTEYIEINNKTVNLDIKFSGYITVNQFSGGILSEYNINCIYANRTEILNIVNNNKLTDGKYLLEQFTNNGTTFKDVYFNVNSNKITIFDILNKQYYDIGNKIHEFTFINKNNYWKYYDTVNPDYKLFTDDVLPQIKTYKIRLESYEPYPLEISKLDVFFIDENKNKTKYMPEFSTNPFTFINPRQSSTSNIEHKASKCLDNNINTFSQTDIVFDNSFKWFEVSLNPPNIISAIEFYARTEGDFKDRINNVKIYLLDKNNEKISWSKKHTSIDDITKKITSVSDDAILSDKLNNPQVFDEISTIQAFTYYPQTYIIKQDNAIIYRVENQLYQFDIDNLKDWDKIYIPLQKEKTAYIERYNNNLVEKNFYIVSNLDWDYAWVLNNEFGIESLNDGFNDILHVYSINALYQKVGLKKTYIYNGNTNIYSLNGINTLENYIVFTRQNVDSITINIAKDNTIQATNIIEVEKFKEIKEKERNKKINDRISKRLENGRYLIINSTTNHILLDVNHPNVSKYDLDEEFDIINANKSKFVKSIRFTFNQNIIDDLNFLIYDLQNYVISKKNILYEKSNIEGYFIITLLLNNEELISHIQIEKKRQVFSSMKIELLSKNNNIIEFLMDDEKVISRDFIEYESIRLTKMKITTIINNTPTELNKIAIKYNWNETNIDDPITENLSYELYDNNNDIVDEIKFVTKSSIIYNNKTVELFNYESKVIELLDIKSTLDQRIRNQIPGEIGTAYYVVPYDIQRQIPFATNNDTAFKITKTTKNDIVISYIDDNLAEDNDLVIVNDSLPVGDQLVFSWSNSSQRYINDTDGFFVMRFFETYDYLNDTMTLIYGDNNLPSTSFVSLCIKNFDVVLKNKDDNEAIAALKAQELLNKYTIPEGNYYSKNIEWITPNEVFLEVRGAANDSQPVISIYKTKKEIINNKYETLEKKSLVATFYQVADGDIYKYILYDTTNFIFSQNSWILKTENSIKSSLNFNDVNIVLKSWSEEKNKFDEKSKNEYLFKQNAEKEIKLSQLRKQIDNNETTLLKQIGGDIYKNNKWTYLLTSMSDVDNLKKITDIDLSNISDTKLFSLTSIVKGFNSRKNEDDDGYKSRGPELWDTQQKYKIINYTSIQLINTFKFTPSVSNSLHLTEYKSNLSNFKKETTLNIRDISDDLELLLNNMTKIRFFIEYKSNIKLMNLITSKNKILWNDVVIPDYINLSYTNGLISSLNSKIKNYNSIKSENKQIIHVHSVLESAYLHHLNNFGTKNVRNTVRTYMNNINTYNKYYETYKLLSLLGPSNGLNLPGKWDFDVFDDEYNNIPIIKPFTYINNKGEFPKTINLDITEAELYELNFYNGEEIFRYDDPYDIDSVNKINEIKSNDLINVDYREKIVVFYNRLFNIRKWQNYISNKNILNEMSQSWDIWHSEQDIIDDTINIDTLLLNLNPALEKKWIIPDPNIMQTTFLKYKKKYVSSSIIENITLFYEKIYLLYTKINNLQKNTPIIEGIYFGYLNKNNLFNVNINNNIIVLNKINTSLTNVDTTIKLSWDRNQSQYINKNEIIKIDSFDKNYVYKLKYNNALLILYSWPTFYEFGNNNDFDNTLTDMKKLDFYKSNKSVNYSKFKWWSNQGSDGGNRNMDAVLGTRLNSQFSIAKGAMKMPFLIYLRNDIILPLRGYNKKRIKDVDIKINYRNKEGYLSFSKNELLEKKSNMEWWIKEWCKALHFDSDENIVQENKLTDGGISIPQSKRWNVYYNTVQIFDNFISTDTIMQWATFLKNTGWDDKTNKNMTHKIIETALYPMMERVVRHMKDLIEFCLKLYKLKDLKQDYISHVDKYILLNNQNTDINIKNKIKVEFQNIPNIETFIENKKNTFINYYSSFEFQKLYKSIKKRTFNEDNNITYEKQGKTIQENIENHMSKLTQDQHIFTSWEKYQEYGWRTYGHGSCGEWFDGAFDHPIPAKRGTIYYNDDLKNFFTKPEATFQYIKNIIGGDFSFDNHIRAITSDYGNNYWFNDYKICVELIVKKQYQHLINISDISDKYTKSRDNKNKQSDRIIQNLNTFIDINYNTTKQVIDDYESKYLYDFDTIDTTHYNKIKLIADFLILPNRLIITLNKSYDKDDINDIMTESDIDTDTDDSFIAIYNNATDQNIISENVKSINKSYNIKKYKNTISYGNNQNCIEYSIPFTEFINPDLHQYIGSDIKFVLYIKKINIKKKKIFAISKNINIKNNNYKFNSKNAYLTYLNYIEKNKLLMPKAREVLDYINNIKISETNPTIINIKKKFDNIHSTAIPESILNYNKIYENQYNIYNDKKYRDLYSTDKWSSLIETLYAEKGLKNTLVQQNITSEKVNTGWIQYIKNYNKDYLDYNLSYEIIKNELNLYKTTQNVLIYYNNVKKNLTLSNINDNIIKSDKYINTYKSYIKKINNMNINYDSDYLKKYKDDVLKEVEKTISNIDRYIISINDGLMFPHKDYYKRQNKIYNTFWIEEKKKYENIKNINKDYVKNINNSYNLFKNNYDTMSSNKQDSITIQTSTINQNYDLKIFKSMYTDFDIILISLKNKYKKIKNLIVPFKKSVNSFKLSHENINKKTDNFIQTDLNTINNEFININNGNLNIKKQIDEYQNILDNYNELLIKNNFFKFDININNLDNIIENIQLENINNYDDIKKYINQYIYYTFIKDIDDVNIDFNITNKQYQNENNTINRILTENAKLHNKINEYVKGKLESFDATYNDIILLKRKQNIEKHNTFRTFKKDTNSLLYKIYNNKYDSTGNKIKIKINNVSLIFKYVEKDNHYIQENITTPTEYYTCQVISLNHEGYRVSIEKISSKTSNRQFQRFLLKNSSVEFYNKLLEKLRNILVDFKKKQTSLQNKNNEIIEKEKIIEEKNITIKKYHWFINNIIKTDISKKISSVNDAVIFLKNYSNELDIQNYLLDFIGEKYNKDTTKYAFFEKYNIIVENTNKITNPNNYGKDSLINILNNDIKILKESNDKIQLKYFYNNNNNYNLKYFYDKTRKLDSNYLKDISFYYSKIDTFLKKNNDIETKETNDKFNISKNEKEIKITNLKNKIIVDKKILEKNTKNELENIKSINKEIVKKQQVNKTMLEQINTNLTQNPISELDNILDTIDVINENIINAGISNIEYTQIQNNLKQTNENLYISKQNNITNVIIPNINEQFNSITNNNAFMLNESINLNTKYNKLIQDKKNIFDELFMKTEIMSIKKILDEIIKIKNNDKIKQDSVDLVIKQYKKDLSDL